MKAKPSRISIENGDLRILIICSVRMRDDVADKVLVIIMRRRKLDRLRLNMCLLGSVVLVLPGLSFPRTQMVVENGIMDLEGLVMKVQVLL